MILNYLCGVASDAIKVKWTKSPVKKGHLIFVPAMMFIASYIAFYSLATYVKGTPYSETSLNYYLDKFHFGQLWIEFGYSKEMLQGATTITTVYEVSFELNYVDR